MNEIRPSENFKVPVDYHVSPHIFSRPEETAPTATDYFHNDILNDGSHFKIGCSPNLWGCLPENQYIMEFAAPL